MKKFIVIPAYNEEKTIRSVVSDIFKAYNDEYNVIVVDDGSVDNTAREAKIAGATVIRHSINRRQGAALVTGTEYALKEGADIIMHMDADGQHDVSNIARMILPVENKEVEMTIGSRFLKKTNRNKRSLFVALSSLLSNPDYPLTRKLLLGMGLIVNTAMTGIALTDAHNGLRVLSRYSAEKIKITQDGMSHNTEYIQEMRSNKLSFKEVPVIVHYNTTEKKSQGFFHGIKIIREILVGKMMR